MNNPLPGMNNPLKALPPKSLLVKIATDLYAVQPPPEGVWGCFTVSSHTVVHPVTELKVDHYTHVTVIPWDFLLPGIRLGIMGWLASSLDDGTTERMKGI